MTSRPSFIDFSSHVPAAQTDWFLAGVHTEGLVRLCGRLPTRGNDNGVLVAFWMLDYGLLRARFR